MLVCGANLPADATQHTLINPVMFHGCQQSHAGLCFLSIWPHAAYKYFIISAVIWKDILRFGFEIGS